MKTGTPPRIAMRAASTFERMPPVPTALPEPPAKLNSSSLMASTRSIRCAFAFLRGSSVYRPSISVMMINLFALTKLPTKRRQRIIVAEFQFIHRDGVILVNDRDDAALQQLVNRHHRVLHALAVGEVVPGQQNLRHANAVGRKCFMVRLH